MNVTARGSKIGAQGITRDGDSGLTRELMHDTEKSAIPTLSTEMQTAPERLTTITKERKAEIEAMSRRKMDFVEREYWAFRNEKQDYMRCPYCMVQPPTANGPLYSRNYVDTEVCCPMFSKALMAILDRQRQVDVAASHVRNLHKVGLVH
jgi:hypothetical protein